MQRSKFFSLAMAVSALGGALVLSIPAQPAYAQTPGDIIGGIVGGVVGAFAFGGRNYCFYDNGWNGPGWYWCGDPYRYGYGWGGPEGWRNWQWRGGMAPGYRHGWRGAPPRGWSGRPGQWNRPNVGPRPGGGGPQGFRPGGGRPPQVGRPGGPRPGGGQPGGGRPGGGRGGPPNGDPRR